MTNIMRMTASIQTQTFSDFRCSIKIFPNANSKLKYTENKKNTFYVQIK